MTIERFEFFIGQLLLAGLLLAIVFTSIGGLMYLYNHFDIIVDYQKFTPLQHHFLLDFPSAFTWSSAGFIQLGFYVLIITQLLRVLLTTFLFCKLRDLKFVFCCLFIFGVLVYCLV